MPVPNPVRLFHITPIANLAGICATGALLSKNAGGAAGVEYSNIAYQGAQGKRAGTVIPIAPGGPIHDYVPFYFAPRSPMLGAINQGRVPGCEWRQVDIVHLETTVDRVVADTGEFVFYDSNATLDWSNPYNDLARLDQIAWDLITEAPQLDGFCKYWNSRLDIARYAMRMEKRQAEFLVKGRVLLARFTRIGVVDAAKQREVASVLQRAGVNLRVEVMPAWYFLGQ